MYDELVVPEGAEVGRFGGRALRRLGRVRRRRRVREVVLRKAQQDARHDQAAEDIGVHSGGGGCLSGRGARSGEAWREAGE